MGWYKSCPPIWLELSLSRVEENGSCVSFKTLVLDSNLDKLD